MDYCPEPGIFMMFLKNVRDVVRSIGKGLTMEK